MMKALLCPAVALCAGALCASVPLSFDSVEVNAPARFSIRNVRVSVEPDGLYATFLPGGFSMTIR